jgi:hypothetical protein
MTCHRCHGFMCPVDLLVGRSGSEYDRFRGWRCVACAEVVGEVIVRNRIHARDRGFVRRMKKFRQPVRMMPAIESRV